MKKYFLLLASATLLLVGCAKETIGPGAKDGEMVSMTVTASVQGEELTKAAIDNDGKGFYANRCIMVLYYGDQVYGRYQDAVSGYEATFDVKVPAKRTYKAVFWADCAAKDGGDLYYNTADLKNITLKSDYVGNDDKRDAFFKCEEYTVENKSQSFTATLTRPFAQINVISKDIKDLRLAALYPQKVNLSFSAATSFNAMSGECGAAEAIAYEADVYKAYDSAKDQLTLSMDYLFAGDRSTVDIEFKAPTEGTLKVEHNFSNIPYQRNYRTNIVGNLLTADAHWDVTINPAWDEPEYFEELWAAGMITPVTPVEDVYTINRPSELAWIAQQVNAGNTFTGKTVKLAKDIDLNNGKWTPMGGVESYPSVAFHGTLDGNNHKILNLNCSDNTREYAAAALIGGGHCTVKDLTIENVKISSAHYAAALVAYCGDGGLVLTNCKVKNGTITSTPEWLGTEYDNGDMVGGLVGMSQACTITGCSVEGLVIKAYLGVGGIAGAAKCAEIKGNIVKDCSVTADQSVNSYGAKPYCAGAIVGQVLEGTVDESNTAENVVVKTLGNAAEKALAEAQDGETVTLKDVDSGNTVNIPAGFAKNVTIASDATDKSGVSRFEIPAGAKIENLTIKDFEPTLQEGSDKIQVPFIHVPADVSFSMTVKDVKATGDGVKDHWNTLVRVESCDDASLASEIVIDGVEIDAAKYLVYSSGGSRAISLTVKNCNIKNLTSWMVMANGSQFKNVTIDNCTIENCSGIVKFAMDSFTFTNNTLVGDNKEDHSASKKCIDYRGSNPTMTVSGNTNNGVDCDAAILAKTF